MFNYVTNLQQKMDSLYNTSYLFNSFVIIELNSQNGGQQSLKLSSSLHKALSLITSSIQKARSSNPGPGKLANLNLIQMFHCRYALNVSLYS